MFLLLVVKLTVDNHSICTVNLCSDPPNRFIISDMNFTLNPVQSSNLRLNQHQIKCDRAAITVICGVFCCLVCQMYVCEQVETVGDKYMAVSGLPEPCQTHARCIARLALDMMDLVREVQVDGQPVVSGKPKSSLSLLYSVVT